MNRPLTTNPKIVYSIVTQIYSFEALSEKLFFQDRSGKLLDNFNMEKDPIDYVTDAIIETIIELATFPIDTDDQVIQISTEIYHVVKMFYDLFELSKTTFIVIEGA